jgi:hypothetical protein
MKKVEAHEAALKASMAAMLRSLGIEPKPVLDTVFEGDEDAIKPQIPGAQWQEAQSTADAQKPSPPQERPDPDALLKKVEEFESTLKDRILKAFDQLGIDRAKAGDIFA